MVEQLTLNQRVAGSSPARFTNPFRKTSIGFFLGPLLQPGKFLKQWTSRKTWHGLQLAYLSVRGSKSEIGVRNVGERQAPGKATTNADSSQLKTDRAGIGNMGRHLRLEKSSDLPVEFGSLDLRLVRLHLRERIATHKEKTGKK